MKRKDVEEKKQNLDFYHNYIDISKIKVLQKLNEEIASLNMLKLQKGESHYLLNRIINKWFPHNSNIYHELHHENDRKELYILIDPKKLDLFSEALLRKLSQTVKERIRPDKDFVITVGTNVDNIARQLNLNIIDHYDLDLFNQIDDFANRIGELVDVGLNNKIFNYVSLLIAQSSTKNNGGLVQERIVPFNTKNIKVWNESNQDENGMPIVSEENEVEIMSYAKTLRNINFKKHTWLPNINTFYEQFVKSVFKQELFEFKSISVIEELKIELQLLDEKKKRLEEQKKELILKWNRARKEEATLQSTLLFSAFKVKNQKSTRDEILRLSKGKNRNGA
ncbi:MMOB1630 family gliding motility ATPase complex subunit [[Mycoplasma] mobile]|uniref:Expressed protein n=1 Tax=Mycoplasma mobile (strain ATCC 43663 / 163K / NCTC 11711) TaxID=267748 RepID=Q6KIC7_MYCM1|nr:hypothetical protein [[Mycoplasma] mobile]AAT27649.1 expressed protein [Mycoplasma mobile 163K]